jgi:hypothetical protein
MSVIESLKTLADQVKGQHPKVQALTVLIQAVKLAHSRGSFSLGEARMLADAVEVFAPEVKGQDLDKEETPVENIEVGGDADEKNL